MKALKICALCLFALIVADPATAETPYRVAVIASMTGDASTSNKALFQAARYAVEEINEQGGLLGAPVEILEFDNQGTSLGSKAAAEAAVAAGADAVIGASWSSHSLAMAPVLEKAGVPMITPMSTNPEVTRGRKYVFRVCYTDDYQGKVMARFAYDDLKARTAVVLCNVDRVYSVGLANVFSETFTALGGKILWRGEFLLDVSDFSKLLGSVREYAPDVIYLPGDYRDSSFIITQARKMGIATQFLGGDSFGQRLYDYIGTLADGAYYTTHWNRDNPSQKSRDFVKRYEAKFGKIKQTTIPMTYDAVMLLGDAVKRAGTREKSKVRDALAATRHFSGVTGAIAFSGTGDPEKPVVINKLENGGIVFVKDVAP
jgi:branched-chain amino acid transport system substrate-binding protein